MAKSKAVTKPKLASSAVATSFAQGTRPAKGRKPLGERSTSSNFAPAGYLRLTINLENSLHKRLRVAAARDFTTIGAIITGLVEKHVKD